MTTLERRKLEGVCICCGSQPPIAGRLRCQGCRDRNNVQAQRRVAESQLIGCCITCGKVAAKGFSRCEPCREKNINRCRRRREEAAKCRN